MATRKEDITVRIVADYAKAEADMQRFTGGASKSFAAIPASVNAATQSVDKLTSQLARNDAAIVALPKHLQDVSSAVDRLNQTVDKMGQLSGPDKLKNKLRETSDEASKLSKMLNGVATAGKFAGATAAGFQAGKMVLAPQLEKMMSYESKLADLTNLANSDKDVAGRLAAMPALNSKIMNAIQGNGGDRLEGLGVYQKILGAGPFSKEQADVMAPAIMRGATASGTEAGQIADIGIAAVQNMSFKDVDLPKIIGMSLKSGDLGGFELGKMAQYLPAQMGVASETLGMKGDRGYAQLLTMNQASMLTEKSPDKAANNVSNLLNKMTSADTLKDFKKHNIDLTKEMMDSSAAGGNPVVAFMKSVDKVMSGNKEYQALEKKFASTKNEGEQFKILEQQRTLLQGAGIGTVLQDMQARMSYFGLKKMGMPEFERQSKLVQTDPVKALETSFGVKKNTLEFSNQQRLNAELNAQTEALANLNPALKTYNNWITKLGETHPALLTALEGGKTTIGTLAASAGVASLALQLMSKNASVAGAAVGGAKVLTGGAYGAGMGLLGKGLNLAAAFGTGWEVGSLLNDYAINPLTKWASGGKSESLGILAYNLTHNEESDKDVKKDAAAMPKPSFSESMAAKRQMTNPSVTAPAAKLAFDPVIPAITLPAAMAAPQPVSFKSPSVAPVISAASDMPTKVLQQTAAAVVPTKLQTLGDDSRSPISSISKPVGIPEPSDPAASGAMQRQMSSPLMTDSAMQRLFGGLKPLPVEARIKLDVAFTESGRPYVQQKSVEGKGIRLDTGPMMTR